MNRLAVLGVSLLVAGVLTAASFATRATRLPAFAGCLGSGQSIRPSSILFACGDGNFYVNRLHWSSWTTDNAAAVGVGHQNDCSPYCAAGHFHSYPDVSIRLARPETCTRRRRLFTRVTVEFMGQKPPGETDRQFTLKAPFIYRSGCP